MAKDKMAARAKAKRAAAKRAVKESEKKRIVNAFYDHCKKRGVKNKSWSREKILQVHHEVEVELEKEANMICVISTLYSMNKLFGYGAVRLYKLGMEITNRITNAYSGERTAYQFADELVEDCDLDIKARFMDRPKFKIRSEHSERVFAFWSKVPVILNIAMYAVYTGCGFKKQRMNKLCDYAADVVKNIIHNENTDHYIDELAKIGFNITKKGKIWVTPAVMSNYNTQYDWPNDNEILTAYKSMGKYQEDENVIMEELEYAKNKAKWIARNCRRDNNGVRNNDRIRTPEYIAMLLSECIKARNTEELTSEAAKKAPEPQKNEGTSYTMPIFIKELMAEIQKGRSTEEATNKEITQTHYNTTMSICQ